jgi:LacI family transcriptional regulator
MIVKLKDVAARAGVSEATASLALNNKPGIKEATRHKVMEAARVLDYTPNETAQSLATSRTKTIGLIITDIENPFFGCLTRHIDQTIRSYGYQLILSISNDDVSLEDSILQDFLRKRIEGIIIVPSFAKRENYQIYETLERRKIPFVFSTTYYSGFESRSVMTDLSHGSYLLVKYLLDMGHRKIGFLLSSDPATAISALRLQGYHRAFEERGVPIDRALIHPCARVDYYSAFQETGILLKNSNIDALITINDYMALGAKRAAEGMGYQIPEDLSIAGYDDVAFASFSEIPLTTVRQNIQVIAHETADRLFGLIRGTYTEPKQVWVNPELIVRQSTGTPHPRN